MSSRIKKWNRKSYFSVCLIPRLEAKSQDANFKKFIMYHAFPVTEQMLTMIVLDDRS